MMNVSGDSGASSDKALQANFKAGMRELSEAVVSIVNLLSLPAEQVSASALGSRLARLLNCLRAHRSQAILLGLMVDDPLDLVAYLEGLGNLRATVGQWLTIHAAQPGLVFVEVKDFEAQCWSTLGIGMVLLDNAKSEDFTIQGALPSGFHQWWAREHSRPAFLAR
jgi:hypothetical protein